MYINSILIVVVLNYDEFNDKNSNELHYFIIKKVIKHIYTDGKMKLIRVFLLISLIVTTIINDVVTPYYGQEK